MWVGGHIVAFVLGVGGGAAGGVLKTQEKVGQRGVYVWVAMWSFL